MTREGSQNATLETGVVPDITNRNNTTSSTSQTPTVSSRQWILIALASGGFAALNGVFAKLTTTESTSSAAHDIASILHLPEGIVEVIVRGVCFALNIVSNIIMWALFTRALTAAPSTTRVSITNTTANFLSTALLGMIIFGERVRGMWWLGAAMMGAGCILVGMREEQGKDKRDGVQQNEEGENIPLTDEAAEYHDDNGEDDEGDGHEINGPEAHRTGTKTTAKDDNLMQ